MAELSWTLQMIDRMSGPAKAAAGAFNHLNNAETAATRAARGFTDVESKLGRVTVDVNGRLRDQRGRYVAMSRAMNGAEHQTDQLGNSMEDLRRAMQPGMTGSLLQAAFWQSLGRSILNVGMSLARVAFEATAFATRITYQFGEAAFAAATWGEDTKSSLAVLSGGGPAQGAAEFEKLRETTVSLGLAVRDSIDAYKSLRAQKFGATEAETMIKLGADLQTVVGATDEAVQRFYVATAQIKAKGKLSAEEMMQIAEGVGIGQGAIFTELSKATGKSIDEVRKLQETGKISADVGIAAIQAAALQMVGASEAGQATAREVGTTLRGMTRLAKSGAEDWILSMGERLLPTFNRIATKAGEAFVQLNKSGKVQAATDAIGASFERLLEGIEAAIPDLRDFLGNVLDWAASGKLEAIARSVGETFAAVAASLNKAWPRIERLLDDGAMGMVGSLRDLADSFDDLLGTVLSVAEFIDEHWTAIKIGFAGVATAAAAAFVAIGASAALNFGRTVASAMRALDVLNDVVVAAKAARAASTAATAVQAGTTATAAGGAAAPAGAAAAAGTVGAGAVAATAAAVGAAAAGIGAAVYQGLQLAEEIDQATWEKMLGDPVGVFGSMAYVMVDAMSAGLLSRAESLAEAAASVGRTAVDALKGAIGWSSPPKAFVALGEGSAAAYLSALAGSLPPQIQLGVGAAVAPGIAGATSAPIAGARGPATVGAALPAVAPGGGGGGTTVDVGGIQMYLEIQGGTGDAESLVAELEALIPRKIRSEVQRVLSSAAGSAT